MAGMRFSTIVKLMLKGKKQPLFPTDINKLDELLDNSRQISRRLKYYKNHNRQIERLSIIEDLNFELEELSKKIGVLQ